MSKPVDSIGTQFYQAIADAYRQRKDLAVRFGEAFGRPLPEEADLKAWQALAEEAGITAYGLSWKPMQGTASVPLHRREEIVAILIGRSKQAKPGHGNALGTIPETDPSTAILHHLEALSDALAKWRKIVELYRADPWDLLSKHKCNSGLLAGPALSESEKEGLRETEESRAGQYASARVVVDAISDHASAVEEALEAAGLDSAPLITLRQTRDPQMIAPTAVLLGRLLAKIRAQVDAPGNHSMATSAKEHPEMGPDKPPAAMPPVRPKRSTERGEGRVKLIAALTKFHKYADGSCLNLEPIGNNELAKAAHVSPSTASAFFNDKFGGHTKYKAICRDPGALAVVLKLLNNEFAPHHLYGYLQPPSEGDRNADG